MKHQYTSSSDAEVKSVDPNKKTFISIDAKIKNLEIRNDEQNKVIRKLQRDVTRLKDQISQLAERISREKNRNSQAPKD